MPKTAMARQKDGSDDDSGVSRYSFMPQLRVHDDRHDMRDMLIAQQVRRIDELEHELDRLRHTRELNEADADIAGGTVYGRETGI